MPRRMLKKAVQQGRSERRGEEVQTALRVGRSSLQWILANGKVPPVLPTSEEFLLNVEPLREARTPLADFFSILLELGGDERVRDGHDSVHDGMKAAEIGVVAGSQPRKCKAVVWPDDSGIESAGVPIFQTT
jgi:hypothetical protein